MLGWIAVIVGGVLAGIIAKAIVPGKEPGGFVFDALIGIVGGIIGRLLMTPLGLGHHVSNPLWNLAVAVLGAVVLLFLYHLATGSRPGPPANS